MTERFGIYFAPSSSSNLWERAGTWLGRDAFTGDLFDGPVAGLERARLLNLTQSANRYGFHATIKAPMALAEGATETELRAQLASFSSRHYPIELGKPRVASIGGFLALVVEPNEQLQNFAAHVVEDFDVFRAPMSVRDRAARLGKGLTERQIELLDAYGYPYVFEEFAFHMTLTDRLSEEDQADVFEAAATWFAPALEENLMLDRLCLFHEAKSGTPFRRIADFKLGTAA